MKLEDILPEISTGTMVGLEYEIGDVKFRTVERWFADEANLELSKKLAFYGAEIKQISASGNDIMISLVL